MPTTPPRDIWAQILADSVSPLLLKLAARTLLEEYADKFFDSPTHTCQLNLSTARTTSARLLHLQVCPNAPWNKWKPQPDLLGLYQKLSHAIHTTFHNLFFVDKYAAPDDFVILESLRIMATALESRLSVVGLEHIYSSPPCSRARSFSLSPPAGSGHVSLDSAHAGSPPSTLKDAFRMFSFLCCSISHLCCFDQLTASPS